MKCLPEIQLLILEFLDENIRKRESQVWNSAMLMEEKNAIIIPWKIRKSSLFQWLEFI